jgi:hypothetical protein
MDQLRIHLAEAHRVQTRRKSEGVDQAEVRALQRVKAPERLRQDPNFAEQHLTSI